MAAVFDAASTGSGNTVANFSWTHTPVGTPTTAVVGVVVRDDAASVVDVDYGGSLMTFVRTDVVDLVVRMQTYVLDNPPAGAKTVLVTLSTSAEATGIAVTVTGSATTGQPANHAGATGDSTAPTVTVTSATDRLVIGFIDSERSNTDAQIVAAAGQTQRASVQDGTANRPRQEATTEAGAASVVSSWTLTNATGWVAQAIDLSAASTGATLAAGAQVLALTVAATLVAGAVTLAAGMQALGLSAPAPSISSGSVTLAAGSQVAGLSAPTATISSTISLAAGAQTLALSTPTPVTASGTVTLAAGNQILALIVPDATISAAGGAQTLTASAQVIGLSAQDAAVTSGASILAADGQTLALSASAATLTAGVVTLSTDAQTLSLSAPDAATSSGASTVAATGQALALSAPTATLIAASNQTLTAESVVLALVVPDADLSASAVPPPSSVTVDQRPTGAAVRLPPTYAVFGVERQHVDIQGTIDVYIAVSINGRGTIVNREADLAGSLSVSVLAPFVRSAGDATASVEARGLMQLSSHAAIVVGSAHTTGDMLVTACWQYSEPIVTCAGVGAVIFCQEHILKEARVTARRMAEEDALLFDDDDELE